jgi:hypothetical protein
MSPSLRLVGGLLVGFATVAVGAPDGDHALTDKPVSPPVREDGQWRARVAAACRALGATFVLPSSEVLVWQGPGGPAYAEHNGMLYRRGTVQLRMGPRAVPLGRGEEMLFGPVVPDRFHAEGKSADLMYLSIVKRTASPGLVSAERRPRERRQLPGGRPNP